MIGYILSGLALVGILIDYKWLITKAGQLFPSDQIEVENIEPGIQIQRMCKVHEKVKQRLQAVDVWLITENKRHLKFKQIVQILKTYKFKGIVYQTHPYYDERIK